ncbi:MAG: hypothetical protein D6744_03420 [Planctomycetota bacterium]|nr:MAG: hypothetical protein D6744_03420 [Planctomycetota bacterium]
MGFLSGPVTYQRFFISGSSPKEIDDTFVNALNQRAFGRVVALPDETQHGWVGPEHLMQTELTGEMIGFGDRALLGIRVDSLKAPPAVVKAYAAMEEQAALEASGRSFLSKGERRKVKAAAVERAEQEARGGAFRRMAMYPLLVDLAARRVYLGGLSASLAERVMHLFSDTFGCALEPADAGNVAVRLMTAAKNARALEHLRPCHFVRPPDEYEESAEFGRDELRFLGREFLTWLWRRTDDGDAPLRVAGGDDVTVMFEKSVRLACDFGLTGSDVITADAPTSLPEARAALRIGKQPTKAGLIVGSPLGEFRLTLDAARMCVSSLTLPEPPGEQDRRERIESRLDLICDAADLLDALFDVFLQERVASDWAGTQREIAAWVAGDQDAPRTHRVVSA